MEEEEPKKTTKTPSQRRSQAQRQQPQDNFKDNNPRQPKTTVQDSKDVITKTAVLENLKRRRN